MHDHSHAATDAAAGDPGRALARTLVLVLVVLVAELVGAWVSGSLALLSDAAHMGTDAAALAISLAALHFSRRPPDERRTFGYHRFEILAALANALMLGAAAAYILIEAWQRLRDPPALEPLTMLWVAAAGLAANLLGMAWLRSGRGSSLNLRAAYLEVWSDMLGSVGVIVGALLIRATGWHWIDSLVAVGIALWVLPRSWSVLREALQVLLEGVPEGIDLAAVEQALRGSAGVQGVHDLHVWSLGSGAVSLSAHVVAQPQAAADDGLLRRLRELLAQRFGIRHSTLQIERQPCEQDEAHSFDAAGRTAARPSSN